MYTISPADLSFPPIEFRRLVGPVDPEAFDNPSGRAVFPDVPADAYDLVLDFGCGCGRSARQLIQQHPRPRRYFGVALHNGMVEWCKRHLSTCAPEFRFLHYDVFHEFMNPEGRLEILPLPANTGEVTLFLAWSANSFQPDAEFVLKEIARVLHPRGIALTTWFLVDKRDFPMMQPFQNTLFINEFDPTNAVIFERNRLRAQVSASGLLISRVVPPAVRGHQWTIHLQHNPDGRPHVDFPGETAPRARA